MPQVKISQSGATTSPAITRRTSSTAVSNGSSANVTATCLTEEVATGGGCGFNENSPNLVVNDGYPNGSNGYYCNGRNAKGSGGSTLTAYVICLK